MAGISDWFSIGSTVACKTCYNKEIEGEVMAFDPQTKMLILKCPSSSNKRALNDVHIVNLSLVSDVQVKHEVSPIETEPPQSLNLHRLNTRVRNEIEAKKRIVQALQPGVSPQGQNLYLAIAKTIRDITWSGENIVVWNEVTIVPPYKVENVHGDANPKSLLHIKKVVEKHLNDVGAVATEPQMQKGNSTQ